MILRITDSKEDFGDDTYVVSFNNFVSKEFHPMIACTEWSKIYIDCTDNTPRGIIRQLANRRVVIPIYDRENITPKVLQLLCEVAPDHVVKLRSSYMEGKEALAEVLTFLHRERWKSDL